MRLEIENGVCRHLTTRRGLFDPESVTTTCGGDVAVGMLEQLEQGDSLEAMPDLGLPSAIQTFDRGLKSRLPRRGKDGSYSEQQASSHDTPDDIGVPIRTDEHVAVVELCIARQPESSPMLNEQRRYPFGCDRMLGPGRN